MYHKTLLKENLPETSKPHFFLEESGKSTCPKCFQYIVCYLISCTLLVVAMISCDWLKLKNMKLFLSVRLLLNPYYRKPKTTRGNAFTGWMKIFQKVIRLGGHAHVIKESRNNPKKHRNTPNKTNQTRKLQANAGVNFFLGWLVGKE